MKRTIAALNLPRRIPYFITYARFVATSLGRDPIFTSPVEHAPPNRRRGRLVLLVRSDTLAFKIQGNRSRRSAPD